MAPSADARELVEATFATKGKLGISFAAASATGVHTTPVKIEYDLAVVLRVDATYDIDFVSTCLTPPRAHNSYGDSNSLSSTGCSSAKSPAKELMATPTVWLSSLLIFPSPLCSFSHAARSCS
jgi:hypothetical protein